MKIRHGFVSNSSTTSFCIYGVRDNDSIEERDEDECLYKLAENRGLEYHSDPYGSDGWIGLSFTNMELDETRQQFQDRVDAILKSLGFNCTNAGVHAEEWRD